jgi:hypothetical protein
MTEAESIFHDLKKKDLLVPFINEHKQACFLLNECKQDEWVAEIEEANQQWIRKKSTWKPVGKLLLWIIAAFLAGYLGAKGEKLANKDVNPSGIVAP